GKARRLFLVLLILVAGTAARVKSVAWNDRIMGDMNLFALTARYFAHHGKLDYPFKQDYFGVADYRAMHSPSSQHPPVFPFLAGLMARWMGSDDTFAILKGITFACGVVAMAVALPLATTALQAQAAGPLALGAAAFLPLLVDFSGNGSPFIALAAIMGLLS